MFIVYTWRLTTLYPAWIIYNNVPRLTCKRIIILNFSFPQKQSIFLPVSHLLFPAHLSWIGPVPITGSNSSIQISSWFPGSQLHMFHTSSLKLFPVHALYSLCRTLQNWKEKKLKKVHHPFYFFLPRGRLYFQHISHKNCRNGVIIDMTKPKKYKNFL